jgi:chitodextrinase
MRVFLRQFPFLICLFLFAAASLNGQTIVADYAFSGNANDVSATANNAAVHGVQLTQDRFGWANSAFSFDGLQAYLEAPNNAALNSDYTTVAFWINVNEIPATGEVYPLSFGGWQERWKISLPAHGKLIWTTNNSSGISDMDAGDGNELVPGTWTHVVMVHDGTKDIIYVNGVMAAEKDVAGTMNSTTSPLGIGYNVVDGGNFVNGSMDEVQIYDYALSALEIEALYNIQNTEPPVPDAIVADYSFSNSTVDGSVFSNHGSATDLTAATDRFGFGNSAFSFNGTTSTFTAANSAHLNSDYTSIGFWIKPNSLPASGEVFLLSNGGWQERWKISLPAHGKPVFTTNNSSGISDMDSGDGNELVVGQWTHVVMVHDGTKDIIYYNGAQVAEKDVAGTMNGTTHPLGVGYNPVDGGGYFDGVFDEVQILNYALSPTDVALAYGFQSTFPGVPGTLVGEYNFAGSTDDTSPFENHGLADGVNMTTDRFGYASNAIQLDGTQGVTAANSIALNSENTTISFWVQVNELPTSGEVFLLSNGGWQERWKISLPSHGKPVFTTHPGFCCSDMDSGDGNELVVGEWTHVAMVHDGLKDIIYFNGAQVAEKDVVGSLDSTVYPLGIGYDPIGNSAFFNGSLDDIQIYNVALTATEIMDLYGVQNTPPVIASDLVADYPFSDNTNDATPYHNNASALGAQLADDRFGQANKAYAFNGLGDGIMAPHSPQLNSDYTTLSFWINVEELPVSGEAFILSNGGWQERLKVSLPSHGKPVFTTHSDGVCCSDMDSGDGNELIEGVWTHVAMTHDGTKDIIYFDGVQVAEKDVAGALDPTTHPLGIGFDPIDNANFFKGSLDEVQIYNTALTAQQIADLYAEQSTPPAVTDTEAPSSPLNLNATVDFNNVGLSWLPSSDNEGVTGYNVWVDGVKVLTTVNTNAYFPLLEPLTEFEFSVSAVDAAGNESLPSSLLVTTGQDETPDTEAPTVPGNLAASTGSSSVLLTWDASIDNVMVGGYVVFVDGIYFDSLAANVTSVLIGGLDAETAYTFEVYAYDISGNNSAWADLTVSTDEEIDAGEPGLVAWYPLDGNADDATPYVNHGVIGGDPVFEDVTHPNGTGNQAIVFDGAQDSVLVANAVQLISDYATIGFWIRVDAIPTDAEDYVLYFGNWDERWKISLPQHLKIVWTTNSNNTVSESFVHDMDSGDGNDLVQGFWWYVTMVHDGVNDIIYIDGQEVNNLPAEGTLNSTGRPLVMGTNPELNGSNFAGALDEVKIYNKALLPEEIESLYTFGSTVVGVEDILSSELASVVQSIYPNPVEKKLVIEHSFNDYQPLLLRVFDAEGRQVDAIHYDKNELPVDQFSIDVDHYTSGTYFVNFVLGGKNLGALKFTKH